MGGYQKIQQAVQEQIRLGLQCFIGHTHSDTTMRAVVKRVNDLLANHYIDLDSVKVTFDAEYQVYNVQLPPGIPTFYGEQSLIGILKGDRVTYAVSWMTKSRGLPEMLYEKYSGCPERIFEDRILREDVPRIVDPYYGKGTSDPQEQSLENFNMMGVAYGTVYLYKDKTWFIRDNINYDSNGWVKLSSYLLFG